MKSGTNLDQRQIDHRRFWEKKKAVRLLYMDFHKRLLEACPEGKVLDIGGGTAHIKEFRSNVISVDILPFPGIDVAADAHQMPFPDGTFAGAVMLDVLHHLERPIDFLREASRVLKPGGRLAMIEPAMTVLARQFYNFCHDEPVNLRADPFAPVAINPKRDPFDANQAIPSLLFTTDSARKRVERAVPDLRVRDIKWLSLFAYPLSGGFKGWSAMPAAMVGPMLAIEERVPKMIRKLIGFRIMIVLERV